MRKDEFPLIDAYADSKVNEVLNKIKEVVEKWKADNFTDGFSWDCMKEIADIVDKGESEVDNENDKS